MEQNVKKSEVKKLINDELVLIGEDEMKEIISTYLFSFPKIKKELKKMGVDGVELDEILEDYSFTFDYSDNMEEKTD